MKHKLSIFLIIIAISSGMVYGIEKTTSQYSPDSALIHIGLSDRDSSSCNACLEDGEYYDSGCKRCLQDGIIFGTQASNENQYYVAWSNDDAMYHGDTNCDGMIAFPNVSSSSNDTYWIELQRNYNKINATLYYDQNYSKLASNVETTMCSNPTDLKYFRISNEDGKSTDYGGRILGYVDDIKLYELNQTDSQFNKFTIVFEEDFENCVSKTCGKFWTLQDSEMLYVDPDKKNFHFDSQVTHSNDYAHYELDQVLSDKSWNLRFKFHIDSLENNPQGEGILKIDPDIRPIFLVITIIIFSTVLLSNIKKLRN